MVIDGGQASIDGDGEEQERVGQGTRRGCDEEKGGERRGRLW